MRGYGRGRSAKSLDAAGNLGSPVLYGPMRPIIREHHTPSGKVLMNITVSPAERLTLKAAAAERGTTITAMVRAGLQLQGIELER